MKNIKIGGLIINRRKIFERYIVKKKKKIKTIGFVGVKNRFIDFLRGVVLRGGI